MSGAEAYAKRALELKSERNNLAKVIKEISWLCDGREDIDSDGHPNLAMKIMQIINGENA